MCSIGPLHQVYVFQHTFNDADIEAKPLQPQNTTTIRRGLLTSTSIIPSDNEQKTNQYNDSARYTTVSDTDRSLRKGRTESSGDELPRPSTTKNDRKNRRLAVVNKILDEMDDVIVSKNYPKEFSHFLLFRIQNLIQIVVEILLQIMVVVILCLVQQNEIFHHIKDVEISRHPAIILIQVDHQLLVLYVI